MVSVMASSWGRFSDGAGRAATVRAAMGVTGGLALALAMMQAGMKVSVFTNAVSRLHLRGAAFLNGKAASAVLITVHSL